MADCCSCTSQLAPIIKGDDTSITFEVIRPDGQKMNFNGMTVKFIVKKNKSQSDQSAVIFKTYNIDTDTTQVSIILTKDDTDVDAGSYFYGIRVIDDDYQTTEGIGKVDIIQGPFYGK